MGLKKMKETTTKTTKATVNKTTAKKVTDKVATTKTNKQLPKPVITKEMASKPVLSETDKILANQKKVFDKHTMTIRKEMSNAEKSFLKIGHALYMISTLYNSKSFKTIGYKDIYDYAQKEFNIARGTCSDFMNIIEQFAKRDEHGNILPELDEKYKAFSSSKLSVMVSLSDDDLEKVTENMTVRAIKDLKKKAKAGQTDASEKSEECEQMELGDIIDNDVEVSNVVISFRTVEEYEKNIDRLDELILRCLKAGHKVTVSETAQKVRTSEQKGV